MTGIERCIECLTNVPELEQCTLRNLLQDWRGVDPELAAGTGSQGTGKCEVGQLVVAPRFERFQLLDWHLQSCGQCGNVRPGGFSSVLEPNGPRNGLRGSLAPWMRHRLTH
ncbi:hypothetical protein D9M68_871800 [compost metagenome]